MNKIRQDIAGAREDVLHCDIPVTPTTTKEPE
jgi:hypothetical protein